MRCVKTEIKQKMPKYFMILLMMIIIIVTTSCATKVDTESSETETKLWTGITRGNLELVKEAVEERVNLNEFSNGRYYEMSPYGKKVNNPVLVATFRGQYSIAEYLVDSGADVNAVTDRQDRSMLQYTLEFSTDLSEKIIRAGADLEHVDKNGDTVLDSAIACAEKKTVEQPFNLLIEHGAIPTEQNLEKALNALTMNKFGIVQYMLTHYDLHSIDPVLKSAFLGDDATVQNTYTQCSDRKLLAEIAAAFCTEDTVKCILDDTCNPSEMLKTAVLYGNKEVAEYLLNDYANEIAMSDRELTSCAMKRNDQEMLALLLENGVSFSMQDVALFSMESNSLHALEYMLDHGLDINYETGSGSLLYDAVRCNNQEAVDMLLKRGADVDGTANHVPLVSACEEGYVAIAKTLIESGANINKECAFSKQGIPATPLSAAVQAGQLECIELLLEYGADVNYQLSNGTTISDLANQYGAKRIIDIIDVAKLNNKSNDKQ